MNTYTVILRRSIGPEITDIVQLTIHVACHVYQLAEDMKKMKWNIYTPCSWRSMQKAIFILTYPNL